MLKRTAADSVSTSVHALAFWLAAGMVMTQIVHPGRSVLPELCTSPCVQPWLGNSSPASRVELYHSALPAGPDPLWTR